MTPIKIYQSFYNIDQTSRMEEAFIPYSNTKNFYPELREYPLLKTLYEENKDLNGLWGMVSWRWTEKAHISGSQFLTWIRSNPGYDLYHYNHDVDGMFKNNNHFVQGEPFCPGMIDYTNKLLKKLKVKGKIEDMKISRLYYTCSHFYVGNQLYWKNLIEFIDKCVEISRKDSKMSEYLFVKKSIHRDQPLINFSFVIERLPSLFLHLNPNYKVLSYPNFVVK